MNCISYNKILYCILNSNKIWMKCIKNLSIKFAQTLGHGYLYNLYSMNTVLGYKIYIYIIYLRVYLKSTNNTKVYNMI